MTHGLGFRPSQTPVPRPLNINRRPLLSKNLLKPDTQAHATYNEHGQITSTLTKTPTGATQTNNYVYDQNGKAILYTETSWDSSTPSKTHTRSHFFTYDDLGQVENDIVIDRETGTITNIDALLQALATLSSEDYNALFNSLSPQIKNIILHAAKTTSTQNLRVQLLTQTKNNPPQRQHR